MEVFGTSGFQDIAVMDLPGAVTLDPSFARGGDILRLSRAAGDYSIVQAGASAVLSDGDTAVAVPVGTVGLPIVFADGIRLLQANGAQVTLGAQLLTGSAAPITEPPSNLEVIAATSPAATGRLFLRQAAEVWLEGKFLVFGTNDAESVWLGKGEIKLDPSFARGGDVLHLDQAASGFTARLDGAEVVITGALASARIPVGDAGMTIDFAGDERLVHHDVQSGEVMIGSQPITTDTNQLVIG